MIGKKSQLSIFILLVIFIIVVFVFLFSFSSQRENNNLDSSGDSSTTNNQVYSNLQEEVDFCLLRSLRKSTIIAGYLGGFIYTDYPDLGDFEMYSTSVSFEEYYGGNFLSDLDISSGYLTSHTLFYHTTQNHAPFLDRAFSYTGENNQNIVRYTRGIEEDFERYIEEDISSCLDFSKYEDQGFELFYLDISGEYVESIDSNTALFRNLDGSVRDNITITFQGNQYEGEVVRVDLENDILEVDFSQSIFPLPSGQEPSSIINSDLGIFVDVIFQDEQIRAEIDFPVSFSNTNTDKSISSISSSASLNNRFSMLKSMMETLVYEKQFNKSLDYYNPDDVNYALNKNNYFLALNDKDKISFIKSPIEDDLDYKQYVYTLVDSGLQIQGQEYVFNVAYQNHAPYLDLSSDDLSCINIDSNYDVFTSDIRECYVVISEDSLYTINLDESVVERQLADTGEKLYFSPYQDNTPTGYFNLVQTGDLEVRSSGGIRGYDVVVGDKETQREYRFVFVVGIPSNDDNEDAKSCVVLNNFDQSLTKFPISQDYQNKLFVGSDGDDELPFGYILKGSEANVSLNLNCFTQNSNSLEAEITISDENDNIVLNEKLATLNEPTTLFDTSSYYKISYDVSNSAGDSLLQEPFTFLIYPSDCLGPGETILGDSSFSVDSCCDMDALESHSNTLIHPASLSSTLKNSGTIFDEEIYFSFNSDSSSSVDVETQNLWESYPLQEDVTSVFKGNIRATCKGNYPIWFDNIDEISSSNNDYSGIFEKIERDGIEIPINNVDFSFEIEEGGRVCSRVEIDDEIFDFITSNNMAFTAGFSGTQKPILESVPTTGEIPLILCDGNYYGREESSSFWTNGVIDWVREDISKSYAYCSENSYDCLRYEPIETMDGHSCKEVKFDGESLSSRVLLDGTTCGENSVDSYNETHNQIISYTCEVGSCESQVSYGLK